MKIYISCCRCWFAIYSQYNFFFAMALLLFNVTFFYHLPLIAISWFFSVILLHFLSRFREIQSSCFDSCLRFSVHLLVSIMTRFCLCRDIFHFFALCHSDLLSDCFLSISSLSARDHAKYYSIFIDKNRL